MSDKSGRFNCLKPQNDTSSVSRGNRFRVERKVNSRWQRSKSPEKFNRFTSRNRGRGKGRPGGGGRRNFRNNIRYETSKKFHNVEKDDNGRPIILGATNRSFNPFEEALKKKTNKKEIKKENKVEVGKEIKKIKPIENTIVYQKKAEKGFKQNKLSDIEKKMILNMQYETDSDEEELDNSDM